MNDIATIPGVVIKSGDKFTDQRGWLTECFRSDEIDKELTLNALKRHMNGNGTKGVVIDVKGILKADDFRKSNLLYWRL